MRRVTNRSIARRTGRSEAYVSRVVNGYERPTPTFRRGISEKLGIPEVELFYV